MRRASRGGQTVDRVEVTAFGGYRFGGELYEIASGRPVDADGAPSFGVVLNIPFTRETQIEALITHQQARFTVPGAEGVQGARFRVTVDHYQVGGLTELATGRARRSSRDCWDSRATRRRVITNCVSRPQRAEG